MNVAEAINRQTNLEDLPQTLTPREVQAFLGLGRATVYRLIEEGKIPVQRIGKRLFIPKKALMEEVTIG
ncbi:helix-turn-helix domain-containing protein [Acidobacteria bacterium AH-259-D05]|nr:helix-turn-helix domain-containing protein [Acidobacteria bacterium AH-259-D05]